ncbi:MAG: hypothetical protein KJ077_10760 [Anaerolineae bacterium]|nr:hypothetical protein [Anaerolineae bacterium]
MKFYHYTPKQNLASILERGLLPGSEVGKGEQLPFVLLTRVPYRVETGGFMFIEVELNEASHWLRAVNEAWVEFCRPIPVEAITAIAYPPDDNAEALRHLVRDPEDDTPWSYQPLAAKPWLKKSERS